nr:hypothetical protein BdHM001_18700 [Bdellovibrio sp. HM001]
MKFFKHFTDADEGTLNDLMNKLGVEAYGRYWLFAEFCIKGLEKPVDREFTEADMKFSFNERQLREKLRIKSVNLGKFLGTCSELNLFQVTRVEEKFNIEFPKILKFLDRDSKRARKMRDTTAPKARQDKEEDKDKEEDVDSAGKIDFRDEAEKCFLAVTLFDSDFKALEWLGESRKPYLNAIGGPKFIRGLKNNDFEVKRVAGLLERSWKNLNPEKESA